MEARALVADAMMRQHLDLFIARAFQTVDGGQPYRPNWHIEVISTKAYFVEEDGGPEDGRALDVTSKG